MKVGDLVNYTGEPFDGPWLNGIVLEINDLEPVYGGLNERAVLETKVYWPTQGFTNWCMGDQVEVISESR